MGKRKTRSSSGKARDRELDASFRDALATAQKTDDALFYVDKSGEGEKQAVVPRVPNTERDVIPKKVTRRTRDELEAMFVAKRAEPRDVWEEETTTTRRLRRLQKRKAATKLNVPATQIAHPGASYRPTQKDYDAALNLMIERANKEEEEKKKVWEATFGRTQKHDDDDDTEDENSDEEEDGSSDEDSTKGDALDEPANNPPVKNEKMTRAQRNRQARRIQHEKMVAEKARAKQFRSNLAKATEISKELDLEEKALKEKRERIAAFKEARKSEMPAPRICGRKVAINVPNETVLPHQIGGGMRRITPMGNLLEEQFNSMLARNMMEVGQRSSVGARREGTKSCKLVIFCTS